MPLFPEYNALFIHIPRTGGTTLENLLQLNCQWPEANLARLFGYHKQAEKNFVLQHLTCAEILAHGYLSPERFSHLFKFTIVRNPYDRCASLYYYWRGTRKWKDFESFVYYLDSLELQRYSHQAGHDFFLHHLIPQYQYIYSRSGQLLIDSVCHFENYDKDLELAFQSIGFKVGSRIFDSDRQKSKSDQYRDLYTPTSRALVARIYAKDFELFESESFPVNLMSLQQSYKGQADNFPDNLSHKSRKESATPTISLTPVIKANRLASPASAVSVSIVIVSHNEGEYLHRTVHSLLAGLPSDGEMLVVDDGSTDGSADNLSKVNRRLTVLHPSERLGVAQARNFGANHSRGKIIVFSDAHVETSPDWLAPLISILGRREVGAVGPAISVMGRDGDKGVCGGRWCWDSEVGLKWQWLGWQGPHPRSVPLLPGGFTAMRRGVFVDIQGFDSGMILYGTEDSEMSLRLWTLGYECWVVPTVNVAHMFRPPGSILPSYFRSWEISLHNQLRMAVIHFRADRIRRVIDYQKRIHAFPAAFARLVGSDAWDRREKIHSIRRYDDEWFFRKFNME